MLGFYLLTAVAGISFVCQQAVNSELRVAVQSPWWAGFISYLGGTICMLVVALALRDPLNMFALTKAPWSSWLGGLFGAIYIGISILMLPRLGALTVVALIVLGQMIGAIAFDHFGILGIAERAITPARVAGALMVLGGVALTRL